MGSDQSMETQVYNLRFTAKQMQKESGKSAQSSKDNELKMRKAMEKGNTDVAKIYAENAIRDKTGSLNYLRLASRIEATAQRLNTAVKMKSLTKDMSDIVRSMDVAMKSMDVEKITQIMVTFEKQFENLDQSTSAMEKAMQQSTSSSMPEDQVEELMTRVAKEHGLQFQSTVDLLPSVPLKKKQKEAEEEQAVVNDAELEERLKRL